MLYGCSAVGRKKKKDVVSFEDTTNPQVFDIIRKSTKPFQEK